MPDAVVGHFSNLRALCALCVRLVWDKSQRAEISKETHRLTRGHGSKSTKNQTDGVGDNLKENHPPWVFEVKFFEEFHGLKC